MSFLTIFKTIYFRKIREIIIFKFFRFFVRNFVFTTSIFTIFAIFTFISLFALINRILHIVIIFDIEELFIRNLFFSKFFKLNFRNLSLSSKKNFVCLNRRINSFNFF